MVVPHEMQDRVHERAAPGGADDLRAEHDVAELAREPVGDRLPDVIRSTHPAFRPIDVKMGPDGAIYIADWYNPIIQHGEVDFRDPRRDHIHGRIWRVTYRGPATVGLAAAPAPSSRSDSSAPGAAVPPEGIHPDAGAQPVVLPTPAGATAEEVALGSRIYDGQVASAPCAGCHGTDGKGSPQGPDLTSGRWLWGDGSFAAIAHTITVGVPRPKDYGAPMPPKGGAELSSSEVSAVGGRSWPSAPSGRAASPRSS